jgi:hypothetical protein
MSYINLQACDPTVQLCAEPTSWNETLNGTEPSNGPSLLTQARMLTAVGLPVLGAA